MKKFVGYVNGKSFDNEEDFNKAAQKAIESGEDNLSISSYYKYFSDASKDEDEVNADDPNFVSTFEYFLGDRKPDVVNKDSVEYNVSKDLEERLLNASNQEGIKKCVNYHIEKCDDGIEDIAKKSASLQTEIEALQNKLYNNENKLTDLKARYKYYNTILDILSREKEKKDDDTEEKKLESTSSSKDKVKEILGINKDISLFDFLKQLGFLK